MFSVGGVHHAGAIDEGKRIVAFGTAFGISRIHLAAALTDTGGAVAAPACEALKESSVGLP